MFDKRALMDFIERNTFLSVVDCGEWFYAAHYVERSFAAAYTSDDLEKLCEFALKADRAKKNDSLYLIFRSKFDESNPDYVRKCVELFMRERKIREINRV